ncbi:MAG: prepilin peptidase [Bacillaceae bacterium]|nr:prepilin peptidase [Bacillaceae bacterium]
MDMVFIVFYSLFSLVIGSFLNVAALRLPSNKSLIWPGSHCPTCGHSLSVKDLIPVLSYIGLKGRCRYCGAKISRFYPAGELLTLLVFLLILDKSQTVGDWIVAFPFAMLMITVTLSDLKYHIIPNRVVYPGILLIFLIRLWIHPLPLWDYIAGAILGSGVLLLAALLSKGGMGGGDIKLFFLIGLVLGWKGTMLALFVSFMLGGLVAAVLLMTGRVGRKDRIPFGPFIFAGTMMSFFYGEEFLFWYIHVL